MLHPEGFCYYNAEIKQHCVFERGFTSQWERYHHDSTSLAFET